MDLQDAFNTFHGKLELSANAVNRIESASSTLQKRLAESFDIPEEDVFLQGSYENGTAVTPADDSGGYDLDLVVEREWDGSPEEVLDELEEALAAYDVYTKMLTPKDPCVCLQYTPEAGVGGFHVDIIPARPPREESDDSDAPLEVPRRGAGWHGTDPQGYTTWCGDQGDEFARTVMHLKRWREVHQPERRTIKSIVLQVLAADAFTEEGSDGQRLVSTLEGIKARLDKSPENPPEVLNPTLSSENLAEKWPTEDYKNFLTELGEAVDLAKRALESRDEAESYELWNKLLGEDFPPEPSDPSKRESGSVPPVPARPRPKPRPDGGRTYG